MEPNNQIQNPTSTENDSRAESTARTNSSSSSSFFSREKVKPTFHTIFSLVLLFSLTILFISVIAMTMGYRDNNDSKYIDKDNMQAVFLNGGQVYFGKIRSMNNKYINLTDIYYLRVNQQVQPKQGEQSQQDIALAKLGCELHGPQDRMLINREQVTFWENLKNDGDVAKAVKAFNDKYPNGQKCVNKQSDSNSSNSNENNKPQENNQNTDENEQNQPNNQNPASGNRQ